jgi:hypothetical protein
MREHGFLLQGNRPNMLGTIRFLTISKKPIMIPEIIIPVVLIIQMGSDDFRVRESATKKLGEQPTDSFVWDFGREMAKKDPEIQRRLKGWLAGKVISKYVGIWVWKPFWSKEDEVAHFTADGRYSFGLSPYKGFWSVVNIDGKLYMIMSSVDKDTNPSIWIVKDTKDGCDIWFRGSPSNCITLRRKK